MTAPTSSLAVAARHEPVVLLEWDTNFFGFPVAQVAEDRLDSESLLAILNFCKIEKVRLLQFKCDAHHRESVILAEANGFHFVDLRITFSRNIQARFSPPALPDSFNFRVADYDNISQLQELADGIYIHSRYYFDQNFARDKVRQFYRDWIRKAVEGSFDDLAWVLSDGKQPIGFCSARFEAPPMARIGLVGLDPNYAGRDLGRRLVGHSLAAMGQRGIRHVEVVTQGRNTLAQRLYQKSGFLTEWTDIYYHRWFER